MGVCMYRLYFIIKILICDLNLFATIFGWNVKVAGNHFQLHHIITLIY